MNVGSRLCARGRSLAPAVASRLCHAVDRHRHVVHSAKLASRAASRRRQTASRLRARARHTPCQCWSSARWPRETRSTACDAQSAAAAAAAAVALSSTPAHPPPAATTTHLNDGNHRAEPQLVKARVLGLRRAPPRRTATAAPVTHRNATGRRWRRRRRRRRRTYDAERRRRHRERPGEAQHDVDDDDADVLSTSASTAPRPQRCCENRAHRSRFVSSHPRLWVDLQSRQKRALAVAIRVPEACRTVKRHTHTHTHMHMHMHTRAHTHAHAHARTHPHTHTHACTRTHTHYTHTHTRTHAHHKKN